MKKNSGDPADLPITAKWGLVGRGQNAACQYLSSAFWHDNSSAAGKESETARGGGDEPKDGSSSHE
jgi:hypothetical protein